MNTSPAAAAPVAAPVRSDELPPLSPMALRIIAQAQDPDAGAAELAKVVELDPAATVALLRLVNSPFYGMPRQVGSVTEAIMVLGLTTVRRVVLAIAVRRPLSVQALDRDLVARVWRDSVQVAALANRLLGGGHAGEHAFTAGVLHDMGRLALSLRNPLAYAPLAALQGQALVAGERVAFATAHDDVGAGLLQCWGLPADITEAVHQHHAGESTPPPEPAAQGLWLAARAVEGSLHPMLWRQLPHITVDPARALEAARREVETLQSLASA